MATKTFNNIRLGAFVLAGLLFLVILLYMIGKNRNLFGDTYVLKARFENLQGLVAGNNVRYSGIQAGTVKKIKILNDTILEVTMIIDNKLRTIIRKNAIASIGTEGVVGNKIVNIIPSKQLATLAEEGDILVTKKAVDTDDMLQILYKTNNDVSIIAEGLKTTVERLNNSKGLWTLLNDQSIPGDLKMSVGRIRLATGKATNMIDDVHAIIMDVKNGQGSVSEILKDTSIVYNLNRALLKINSVVDKTDSITSEINGLVADVRMEVRNGKGTANALLKDSMIVRKLNTSLDNIKEGTIGFNQNMEALKHNFLLRSYFKKLERQKIKQLKQQASGSGKKSLITKY